MQRLNRGMMSRYEIPEHIPAGITAAQFGMDELLLGVADRLLDGAGVGVACVPVGAPPREGRDPAALLREQDGLYTLLARGYRGETPVNEEIVVQSVVRVTDGEAEADALAEEAGLKLCLVNAESEAAGDALGKLARLLALRHRAGLPGLDVLCLGEDADCAKRARTAVLEAAEGLSPAPGFAGWLEARCAFHPALADGIALRADAKEAAAQCAKMNYADGMLHMVEPFARLLVQAPAEAAARLGLEGEGIEFTEDIAPALAKKHRLFDAGLFLMAAPGWLLGCDTLSDCMKHEGLRNFVGRGYMEELLPADAGARAAEAGYVERCFERFENPLNRNGILRVCRGLLERARRDALPLIRAWAEENFEPPRRLSFTLAATIMLYAGARKNPDTGRYEVARGKAVQPLEDEAEKLAVFATLSHDMPPEALAYAALADRELWDGADLREIDGLEARVALDIAAMQRNPAYLPE